jgi:DNA invertase Pin-like site-specific DNA recombinase
MGQPDENLSVAGYVRVSTEQQRDEGSHERQRDQLVEWADRHGHDLELFEDIAISGQSDERPAYDELMERVTAGEFDAVAVRELSRFGRSLQQVLNDIDELQDAGVEFMSVSESFDTSSAMGRAMMQMVGVFNEFWANLARERARENVERRRAEGEPIGRPTKLGDDGIEQVREWRRQGHSLQQIKVLVENMETYDVEEIDRSTIHRYCGDVEKGAETSEAT